MTSAPVPAPPGARWQRTLAWLVGGASIAVAVLVSARYGQLPAPRAARAPQAPGASLLAQVQREAVAEDGGLRRAPLARLRPTLAEAIDAFDAEAERATGPSAPVDAALAYWLNVAQALALAERADGAAAHARVTRLIPLGGRYLNRATVEDRILAAFDDPRVALARFDGTRGGGVLDGAPYAEGLLDAQLNDGVRRALGRPLGFRLDGSTALVSPRVLAQERLILAVLPEDRRHVLQFVWAFLPDTCEGDAGACTSRADLDQACGRTLDGCTLRPLPDDDAPLPLQ